MSFIKHMILSQTNNNLPVGEKHVQYGEFLRWLGLWMLMETLIGPRGMISGQDTQSTPSIVPLFIWESG